MFIVSLVNFKSFHSFSNKDLAFKFLKKCGFEAILSIDGKVLAKNSVFGGCRIESEFKNY